MIKTCPTCKKDFETRYGKYCSHKCFSVIHSKRMSGKNHPNYGKHFSDATREKISNSRKGKYFGKNNTNYKGGKCKTSHGYIAIFNPSHPAANIRGYVYEHRLNVEKYLGRYLTKNEVVHHIKEKTDNRINNLIVFSKNSVHISFHSDPNKINTSQIIFDGRTL